MAMIQGKARWFKVLGKPVDGFDPGEKNKQWEFDLIVDEATKAKILELNPKAKFRETKDGETFYKWTKRAYNKDGEANKPIRVVDAEGNDWDRKIMVGNDSVVNVKFNVREWDFGKKHGTSFDILAIQIWDHVPYEGGEQFPVKGDGQKAPAEQWGEEE